MPISNGFEACKNIVKIYDKNQLLKIDKKNDDYKNMDDDESENSKSNLSFVNNRDLKPLMIACSGEVLDDQL
jgi:hypothetical protein